MLCSADPLCVYIHMCICTYVYMSMYIFHDLYITDYFPLFVTVFPCRNNVALNIFVNIPLGHTFKISRENTEELNYWAIGKQLLFMPS